MMRTVILSSPAVVYTFLAHTAHVLFTFACAIVVTPTVSRALPKMNNDGIHNLEIAIAPSQPKYLAGTITS